MRRFKRVFGLLMLFSMLFLFLCTKDAMAATVNEMKLDDTGLFIETESTERFVDKYIKSESNKIIMSLPEVVPNWDDYVFLTDKITFGMSFVLGVVDYYPIICEDKVIALVGVVPDRNNMGWTLSTDFSDGLNEISELTTEEDPAELFVRDGNVYAEINNEEIQLTDIPEVKTNEKNMCELVDGEEKAVVNVLQKDVRILAKRKLKKSIHLASTATKYLTLDRRESQSGNSWCSAYSTAQILRYNGINTYARQLMKWAYPGISDTELLTKRFTHGLIAYCAQGYGFNVVEYCDRLSFSAIKSQIDACLPIYIDGSGGGGRTGRHAFVLRGYNDYNKSYSVWNPWNTSYTTVSNNSSIISVNGGYYDWNYTIYNWQR